MSKAPKCACGCGGDAPLITKSDKRKGWVKGEFARFIAGHHARLMKGRVGESRAEVRPISDVGMTQEDIEFLRGVSDADAARELDQRTVEIRRSLKHSFVELGLICLEVQRRELWMRIEDPQTKRPFHSFDAWVMGRLDMSRSMAYDAMKILKGDVSVDDLREMPRGNAKKLTGLSSAVQRDPEMVKSAKQDSEAEFVKKVRERHPEQHLEPSTKVLAKLDESQHDEVLDTFEMVGWCYDVSSREDILANLCAYFRDGQCEREGYLGMTNAMAFERRFKEHKKGGRQ